MTEDASQTSGRVTGMLQAIGDGDERAAADLLPLVYDELRRMASRQMRRVPPGQTLQATALVHEAYVRLVGKEDPGWNGRGHFYGAAARAMRNILVDQARRKAAVKHGGGRKRVHDAVDVAIELDASPDDLIALDEALERLERDDPRKAQAVLLRYFAGLTYEQVALALGVSLPTAERDLRFARAWLERELAGTTPGDDDDDRDA